MGQHGYRIRSRDSVDSAEWDELLASDDHSMLFHRPAWLTRFARHYQRKQARWLELRGPDGQLLAGIPFVVTRRLGLRAIASGVAGTYGGPVCREGALEAGRQILRHYLRVGGKRCILREMMWGLETPPLGAEDEFVPIETAILDLSEGAEGFWSKSLTHNRRNECNRSAKRGLVIRETRDIEVMRAFYPLYEQRCREWGRAPHPLNFLTEVLEEEESSLLIAGEYEGRVVGLHICFVLGTEFFAWLGTSERLREVFPATMMVKAGVEAAVARGCKRVNLGSSLGLRGVSDFKKLVGAESSRRWLLHQEAGWLRRLRSKAR